WWVDRQTLFYVDDDDQRIWRLDPDFEPVALTPPPRERRGVRYADGIVTTDGRWVICVAEVDSGEDLHHGRSDEPADVLVVVPATGGVPSPIFNGSDFVSSPR